MQVFIKSNKAENKESKRTVDGIKRLSQMLEEVKGFFGSSVGGVVGLTEATMDALREEEATDCWGLLRKIAEKEVELYRLRFDGKGETNPAITAMEDLDNLRKIEHPLSVLMLPLPAAAVESTSPPPPATQQVDAGDDNNNNNASEEAPWGAPAVAVSLGADVDDIEPPPQQHRLTELSSSKSDEVNDAQLGSRFSIIPPLHVQSQEQRQRVEEKGSRVAAWPRREGGGGGGGGLSEEGQNDEDAVSDDDENLPPYESVPKLVRTPSDLERSAIQGDLQKALGYMPACAEKSLVVLHLFIKNERARKVDSSVMSWDEVWGSYVSKLQEQIKTEELQNQKTDREVEKLIKLIKEWVSSSRKESVENNLSRTPNDLLEQVEGQTLIALRLIQPLDVELLMQYLQESLNAQEKIVEKDVILLFGMTGSGKR